MDLRAALKEQYHAGLAMLADCVEKCPDDLWAAAAPVEKDEERTVIRSFWRIAFHNAYFTHLYLGQNEDAFQPWPNRRQGHHEGMWHKPWDLEPYELPEDTEPYTRREILQYISYVDGLIDPTVDQLDLDSPETGFHWYRNMTKLSHQIMNVRHVQGHVGQLSELLMQGGIDTDWVSRVR
ncbi:MAG: hypothetical protein QOJ65_2255 [Fimbriimonadaceae bacterium]|jgi:hypothetical protein|nr:hypothetical protein [Fimbriimonadaceae bacterium]